MRRFECATNEGIRRTSDKNYDHCVLLTETIQKLLSIICQIFYHDLFLAGFFYQSSTMKVFSSALSLSSYPRKNTPVLAFTNVRPERHGQFSNFSSLTKVRLQNYAMYYQPLS